MRHVNNDAPYIRYLLMHNLELCFYAQLCDMTWVIFCIIDCRQKQKYDPIIIKGSQKHPVSIWQSKHQ